MTESPILLKLSVSHYQALLKLDLDNDKRDVVRHNLAEVEDELAQTRVVEEPH